MFGQYGRVHSSLSLLRFFVFVVWMIVVPHSHGPTSWIRMLLTPRLTGEPVAHVRHLPAIHEDRACRQLSSRRSPRTNLLRLLRLDPHRIRIWFADQRDTRPAVEVLRLSVPVAIVGDMSETPIGPQVPIRQHREGLGISVASLIERIEQQGGPAGTHPDTIRNIELGYKRASKPLMAAWARALGLSPIDVYQPEPVKSSIERAARTDVA